MEGGQPKDITQEVMQIFLIDRICQRYGWTFTQFEQEFERHPQFFGWLFELLESEAEIKSAQQKEMDRESKAAESRMRKQRLGV